jgi:hypothetical protein
MGENHTIILSNGNAYSCGDNKYGQLGTTGISETEIFTQIIINEKISNIFASRFHSIINSNPYVCNGMNQYDLNVCSGKGNCIDDHCICDFQFFGDNCQYTSCNGIESSNNSVCSSKGFIFNFKFI